jgi:hypothetical protein
MVFEPIRPRAACRRRRRAQAVTPWYALCFRLGQGTPLKAFLIILLLCVSGCSWFHRKPHAPDPTELIVTGAPVGSMVFVDGVQAGQAKEVANRPQEIEVAPGTHILEVRMGDTVAYRENTYVTPGEKRVISVLSGRN